MGVAIEREAGKPDPGMTPNGWPRSRKRWRPRQATIHHGVLCRRAQGMEEVGLDLIEEERTGRRRVEPLFRTCFRPEDVPALFEAAAFLAKSR